MANSVAQSDAFSNAAVINMSRYNPWEDNDYQSLLAHNGYRSSLSSSPGNMRAKPSRTGGHRSLSISSTFSTSPSSISSYGSEYQHLPSSISPEAIYPPTTNFTHQLNPSYTQQYSQQRQQQQQQQQQQSQYRHLQQPLPTPTEYICLFPLCAHTSSRKADLERHVKFTHNRDSICFIDCSFQGECHRRGQYGFTRKDKMTEHLREVHKVDVPKKNGGQAASGRGK